MASVSEAPVESASPGLVQAWLSYFREALPRRHLWPIVTTVGDQGLVSAGAFALSVLLARHTAQADYGVFVLAYSASNFLLDLQNLMGQIPQLFLHVTRLLQQPALILLAFLESCFHRLPPDNFPLQLLVRGGEILHPPLRLLGPLEHRNVRDCHPAPFPRFSQGDSRRGLNVSP